MIVETNNVVPVTSGKLVRSNYVVPYLYTQRGITEKQIHQLILFSQTDSEIAKFTTDNMRFRSLNSFREWDNRGDRVVYTLTDFGNNLNGISWLAGAVAPKESIDEDIDPKAYPYTFAIRIYNSVRGQGLASLFMDDVLKHFKESLPEDVLGIWLRVNSDNDVAKRTYIKYGFKSITKSGVEKYNYMVLDL